MQLERCSATLWCCQRISPLRYEQRQPSSKIRGGVCLPLLCQRCQETVWVRKPFVLILKQITYTHTQNPPWLLMLFFLVFALSNKLVNCVACLPSCCPVDASEGSSPTGISCKWMIKGWIKKAVAHRSLKHLYGKMLMFLNLFETSETTWHLIRLHSSAAFETGSCVFHTLAVTAKAAVCR